MRKGSKYTPEQLERIRAAAKKRAADPNWQAAVKAEGQKRSQDPKWQATMKNAGAKRRRDPKWLAAIEARSQDPKWQAAHREAMLRPEVIESKITYVPKQPWNRATITTEKNLKRYDQGLCRYCNNARQPERKECYECFVRGLERRRKYAAQKRAAKAQARSNLPPQT